MRDSEIVASIVARDPAGPAEAYDRYADPLYKYYECLRIAAAGTTATALEEAPEVTAGGGRVSDAAEPVDLPSLVEDAAAGLNPAEREAIELQLRQGLEPAEIAIILGLSRKRVQSLLPRARDQMLASIGVLLVGRAGRDDCRELASMLSDWDGRLSVPLRKRVHRHIERCGACTARRAVELRPARLLGLSPPAAIAAATAESLRSAAGPPAALRAHTLTLAIDRTPSAVAHRAAVLNRAGPFGRDGFPRPVRAPLAMLSRSSASAARRSPARKRTAAAAGVVIALVAAAAAFALAGNGGRGTLPGGGSSVPAPTAAVPGSSDPPASPTATHHRNPSATPPAVKPTRAVRPAADGQSGRRGVHHRDRLRRSARDGRGALGSAARRWLRRLPAVSVCWLYARGELVSSRHLKRQMHNLRLR